MCAPPTKKAAEAHLYKATAKQAETAKAMHDKYMSYLTVRDAWQAILSGIVGTYAMVKQYELFKEQIRIAEDIRRQQQEYLVLAQRTFDDVLLPTHMRQRDLFDRFKTNFSNYEDRYTADAFRLKEYSPEYSVQEGRTLGSVQAQFDRAALMKRRMCGKYNTGRACDDATKFSIVTALAKVDAVNHGYRFEESRKRALDAWYWERRSDGIKIVDSMRASVVSGLNQGTATVVSGLNAVGNAYKAQIDAYGPIANAYSNMGNFWGTLANGAFRSAGYALGRMNVSPFGMGSGMGGGGFGFQFLGQGTQGHTGATAMSSPYSPMSGGMIQGNANDGGLGGSNGMVHVGGYVGTIQTSGLT